MKVFIKSFAVVVCVLFITGMALVYLALQSHQSTVQLNQINAASAKHSQQLAQRIVSTLKQKNTVTSIRINQQEANGLTALLHRAFPRVNADVRLSKYGAAVEASFEMPLPSMIKYLNVNAYISPSKSGLLLEEVSLGGLKVSGEFFISLVRFAADNFLKEQLFDDALAMITAVDINEERLIAHLSLDENLLAMQKNDTSFLIKMRDDLALFGNVDTIAFYYQSLSDFARLQDKNSSIAVFIRHVFDLAKTRSGISQDYLAVKENQAAITALIIYFGADRFELMVGDVIIREKEQLVIRNRLRKHVSLQNRPDLQKHFIYSMALQLFSSHGASDAIGEFKEFLDTNKGGSGFSFADLQADRAGTRLAMIVTKSEQHAQRAQQLLAKVTDAELLPSIEGLHEGLNEENFDKKFKNVLSKDYQQTLAEIDKRLKNLPVYQLGWE
ncbi:hypothetical protein [Thalassotalea castellviae]|uniref:Uncharacterized protein n=1 Tax=Thalassotalea castellviae TaxID=3075612 RepID=A0ABU3A4B1_9GAMM|nr:hypothetical protein [Thalassotalea sp. W431]MDT0604799.1 hypothetical protein [Thalassotalea sp. W431]